LNLIQVMLAKGAIGVPATFLRMRFRINQVAGLLAVNF
jgi:hypothetical protein